MIFSAVHLKRYCGQFGVPLPAEVRLLYEASKWNATASTRQAEAAPAPQRSGSPVQPRPAKARQADAPPNLPSGTVTFLFTDVEGSTKLWEQYPEAMQAALARHDAILHEAVAGHHGLIVKSTGDGIHAAFDTAANGLAAAVAAQKALYAEKWVEIQPQVVRVRMGLHTGEVETRAGDYYGPALNRAARLMSIGYGGQTLVSATTADLARDQLPAGASLRDLGEHSLKDLARAEHVYQLVHPDLPAEFPPLKSLNAFPNNMPVQLSTFIGRQAQVQAVKDLLSQEPPGVRLLTLTGPGGTGKRAWRCRRPPNLIDRFDGGEFFVDLAPIREPEPVVAAIAQAVGLRQTSDRPLLEELKAQLRAQRMLLLLDNFEQVTAAAPKVVDLLQDCPELKLLVTSREALHVRGEHVYPIPPLALPATDLKLMPVEQLAQVEAIRLFCERAQAVKPDFALTDQNAAAVAEICLRLDGLPLAIELASARIRLFTPQALLERVGSRLKLLRGGARDLALRQQTLRAAIDWSYELLDEGEQRLFALLSLFPGCTYDAVEAVASEVGQLDETGLYVLDGLASLVDKSLMRQIERDNGEPRMLMLETIREYAAERLNEDAEFSAAARRAHAAYYADFTQSQWARLAGAERDAALADIETDIENVRAAWRYWVAQGDFEQLGKFVDSLWLLNDIRGWYHATVDLTSDLLKVLATTPSTPERIQQEIMLLTSLARALLVVKGYTPEVEEIYARALELSQAQGEIPQVFPVLRGLSSFYAYQADFAKGAQIGEQILSLAERQGDAHMRVEGHFVAGYNIAFLTDLRRGLDHLEQGIAEYDPDQAGPRRFRLGNDPGVASYTASALFLWLLGFPDRALKRANSAVALAKRLNHPFSLAYALFHTGLVHLWRRELEFVQARAEAVLAVAETHEFHVWRAVATCLHGAALSGLGRAEEGLRQTQQGIKSYQLLKTPPIFWPLLLFIQAQAYVQAGKPAEGLIVLEEALEIIGADSGDPLSADLLRLKGELLLALSADKSDEAEYWYQKALEVAQKRHTSMFELRAATSLAGLWQNTRQAEEGRRILREAYEKLNEGFTTADLKEAKALLDKLSQ